MLLDNSSNFFYIIKNQMKKLDGWDPKKFIKKVIIIDFIKLDLLIYLI